MIWVHLQPLSYVRGAYSEVRVCGHQSDGGVMYEHFKCDLQNLI